LFAGSILAIFKKENLHRLWISWCNISTIGIEKKSKFISNPFFLSSHTHSYLLIFLKYKNQVFLIFIFLMSFQLTSLRYSQGAPAKKQTHFYWKFYEDEISAQDRIWKTMYLKFEHSDLAISEVSHYGFLRGNSSR
jgi:hypothetical protein